MVCRRLGQAKGPHASRAALHKTASKADLARPSCRTLTALTSSALRLDLHMRPGPSAGPVNRISPGEWLLVHPAAIPLAPAPPAVQDLLASVWPSHLVRHAGSGRPRLPSLSQEDTRLLFLLFLWRHTLFRAKAETPRAKRGRKGGTSSQRYETAVLETTEFLGSISLLGIETWTLGVRFHPRAESQAWVRTFECAACARRL